MPIVSRTYFMDGPLLLRVTRQIFQLKTRKGTTTCLHLYVNANLRLECLLHKL